MTPDDAKKAKVDLRAVWALADLLDAMEAAEDAEAKAVEARAAAVEAKAKENKQCQ